MAATAKRQAEWTKDAEIAWLDNAIAQLGNRSYLGPWLAEYRAQIAADIRNDFAPSAPMPSVARREAADMIATADERAQQIVADARTAAQRLTSKALDDAAQIRRDVRRQLEAAANRIDY